MEKSLREKLMKIKEEKYFKNMESAFGINKNIEGKEAEQFEDMETVQDKETGTIKHSEVNGEVSVSKNRKETGKDAVDYYKEVGKKMSDFQKPSYVADKQSQIGEAKLSPKVDREESDDEDSYEDEAYGTGMQGLKYDDEGSPKHSALEDRMEKAHAGDPTYKKLKDAGEKYKEYKYGKETEYHNSPKVRVENKTKMKYTDVIEENIFKANGKLISEAQVLKLANKVPSRVKVDESVFAITDGENYYRLMWEGDRNGEPVITHSKNENKVNESVESMKKMWEFNPNDTISTKKNITESPEDMFKKMLNKVRNTDGLVG